MSSLFTSQVPASTDNSDGAPGITFSTSVRFAQNGTVTGVRFYATGTVSGTYTGALWQVTASDAGFGGNGTLLASKVRGSAPTPGTWNDIVFDTPVSVTAGVLYRVGVFSGAGRYVATLNFFGSDLVNGDITADADHDNPTGLGELWQGTFTINAALSYPVQSANSANYFADVLFTAAGGGTPFTKDLALAWRVLGSFTKDLALSWRVLNAFTKDVALTWRVLNTWSKDLALVWNVSGSWTKDLEVQWRVLNAWSKDLAVEWRVLALWSKDLELLWAVRADWAKDLTLVWHVRAAWERELVLRWRVLSDTLPPPLPAGVIATAEERVGVVLVSEVVTVHL